MSSLKLFERMLEGKETPYTDGANGINNVAAILVEPFQSSAGYYIPATGVPAGAEADSGQVRDAADRGRDPGGSGSQREAVGLRALGDRTGT